MTIVNLAFSKPFQITSAIEFKPDTPVSISLVTLSATLPNPSGSVQLSKVSGVQVSITLAKPSSEVQLSRVHVIDMAPERATKEGDTRATKDGVVRSVKGTTEGISLPKPLVTCYVQYDNNVWRGVEKASDAVFDETTGLDTPGIETHWKGTASLNIAEQVRWDETLQNEAATTITTEHTIPLDSLHQTRFDECDKVETNLFASFDQMIPKDSPKASSWDESKSIDGEIGSSSDQCLTVDTTKKTSWDISTPSNVYWFSSCDVSRPLGNTLSVPFDESMRVPGAFWWRPTITPQEPPPDIRTADIVFGDELFEFTPHIVFGIKIPKNKIISKRFYYMLHSFYLRRLSDNQEIQISKIDATLSQSDYTWGFDFTVIGTDSYNKLKEYAPMELELMVNGWKWKILLTDIKKSHRFGGNTYSGTGIGLAGYLSDLYIDKRNRTETSDMTVQQLAISETNGTLFNLDWQASNWLVAGNTFAYQDKTPIEAISDIVSSAGAFILPDRELKKLTVKPKYPSAPWLFNSLVPDLSMSPSPIISREMTYQKRPDYDSVWISGTTPSGIMASVVRTGYAGSKQPNAPITHQLITDPDGARAMGIRYLGDNLSRHNHRIVLPLTNDVPLIEEGILLQVNDTIPWRGIVTGTAINLSLTDRAVTVRQTIEVDQPEVN